MRVSMEWLREFVSLDLSPTAVADKLTMAGLEVEDVEAWGAPFERIVVGEIGEITLHPSDGRLSVCRVDVGAETLTIVCGAHNIALGDIVPVALVRASLPSGKIITAERIAGVVSQGMLCSGAELGFMDTAAGIWVLPSVLRRGESLADALHLRDVTLEVSVTPNRPDCLSIVGVAREIAALTGSPLKLPDVSVPQMGEPIGALTSVAVEAPELCPRYAARLISGLGVGPSPLWMQRRLLACGARPRNNVVDVTNYVLLELGHPLHAFDYDTLREHRIVVRVARPGEICVTLDGVPRTLDPSMLVIADAERPVGLAGVMGGQSTEIQDSSRSVLLESAYFQPQSIRRTSKKLGLRTEASYRFERGADFEGLLGALDRTAALMARLAGGMVAKERIDVAARRWEVGRIPVRVARVNQVLGTDLTSEVIAQYCARLQLHVRTQTATHVMVDIPSFRRDVTREIDLIEEVARLHGYQAISTSLPQIRMAPTPHSPHQRSARQVLDWLVGCGYTEVINYSFMNAEDLDRLQLPADDPLRHTVPLRNPLSKESGVLRTTLIPGLLRILSLNLNRDLHDLRLCELSKVFRSGNGTLPQEPLLLGLAVTGHLGGQGWAQPARPLDFYDVVGTLEVVASRLHLEGLTCVAASVPYCHPGNAALVKLGDDPLGMVGELHPAVLAAFDLSQPVILAEVDVDRLVAHGVEAGRYRQVPRFPSVTRDLSIIVDAHVEAGRVLTCIRAIQPALIQDVRLFDVYAGTPVPAGKKSLTFALVYRADDRTLTDEEVNHIHARVVEQLSREFGAQLRGQGG
ncbi:MAG: phenylalanine--tRNA ligase subunit beta [Nitrospinae bacterium]|nr:phenylalanine--tRNA ligase subunit beta [Nitrospinota bacterium]